MKYVLKPVPVEAMQWDGSDEGAKAIHLWSCATYGGVPPVTAADTICFYGSLQQAKATDWIVKRSEKSFTVVSNEDFNGTYSAVPEPIDGFEEALAVAREQLADIVTDMIEGPDSEDLARRLFRPMLEWLLDQHKREQRPQAVVSAWIHIGAYISLWVNASTRTPEEKTHGLVNMLELMRKEALVLHSMDEAEDFEVTDLLAEKAAAGTTH